jgi:hypothetical protein
MTWKGNVLSMIFSCFQKNGTLSLLFSATCSEPPPHQSDSWRAVQLAADNEMFLDSIERFQELEGYQTSGRAHRCNFSKALVS